MKNEVSKMKKQEFNVPVGEFVPKAKTAGTTKCVSSSYLKHN
jgi:hypothetical protein